MYNSIVQSFYFFVNYFVLYFFAVKYLNFVMVYFYFKSFKPR